MLRNLRDRWFRPTTPDPGKVVRQKAFAGIFAGKHWGEGESVSGPGSGIARAALFRTDFERLLRQLSTRTLLDAGCGNFNWLPTFDLPDIKITGIDIVEELIALNRARHPQVHFEVADFVTDRLPRADLILCRDGLVHIPNADVLKALVNFRRSGATWLLTNTFVDRDENLDIETGAWRPLNLCKPPFALRAPSFMIDEYCLGYDGAYRDKRLAVWPVSSLPCEL